MSEIIKHVKIDFKARTVEQTRSQAVMPDSVRPVEIPRRITDKWTRERSDAELRWLARDYSGSCNGYRFDAEIRRRKEVAPDADIRNGDRGDADCK